MSTIITILVLIIMLGLLIFVHELGHFIMAKKNGVYVYEFALGMGPKIFSFTRKNKKDPTLYSLRLFPIGGFCSMAGEVEEVEDKNVKKSEYMCNKKAWQRFQILVAGVTMNFLLALLLLFIQALIFGSVDQKSYVGRIEEGYPISEAGIEVGDRILSINGRKTRTWDNITVALALKNEDNVYTFEVEKQDGSVKIYEITPKTVKNEDGTETKTFGLGQSTKIEKGVLNAIKYSFTKFVSTISTMNSIIGNLFIGKLSLNSLSGPVGMYSVVGESIQYGFNSIIFLTAYLSVNLGYVNLLPFPAFDGGRILFVIIEKIKGSKVDPKVENMLHNIGFMLLMLLMLVITFNDILRLF